MADPHFGTKDISKVEVVSPQNVFTRWHQYNPRLNQCGHLGLPEGLNPKPLWHNPETLYDLEVQGEFVSRASRVMRNSKKLLCKYTYL